MSRSESVTLTVRSRQDLLRLFESQRDFVLPPLADSPKSLCAVSADYLGIPNWEFIQTENADDLFEKMRAALRGSGVCGFRVLYYDMQFSVEFLDDKTRGCVATWIRFGASDAPPILGFIPDPRKFVQAVLQSIGRLVDEVERVTWEYGE